MSDPIAFIRLVENHPTLWNCKLKSYSKADIRCAAWKNIADQLNDTERNCRERWRNIRTAFGRSLKPPKSGSGRTSKKPYYLAEHLTFLLPYLKEGDEKDSVENCSVDEAINVNCNIQDEAISGDEISEEESYTHAVPKPPPSATQNNLCSLRNSFKREKDLENETDTDFLERTSCKRTKQDEDGHELFFRSLLPDMRKLNERRQRSFKLQVMSLLDKMLLESESEAPPPKAHYLDGIHSSS